MSGCQLHIASVVLLNHQRAVTFLLEQLNMTKTAPLVKLSSTALFLILLLPILDVETLIMNIGCDEHIYMLYATL